MKNMESKVVMVKIDFFSNVYYNTNQVIDIIGIFILKHG